MKGSKTKLKTIKVTAETGNMIYISVAKELVRIHNDIKKAKSGQLDASLACLAMEAADIQNAFDAVRHLRIHA